MEHVFADIVNITVQSDKEKKIKYLKEKHVLTIQELKDRQDRTTWR